MNRNLQKIPILLATCVVFITAFGIPASSHAQSCGGPACSSTQICCRRDLANGAQGSDADYQFMLCVEDMQACTNMGGYNAYPNGTPQPAQQTSQTCTSTRQCPEAGTICVINGNTGEGTCRPLPPAPQQEAGGSTNANNSRATGGGLINVLKVDRVDQLVVLILGGLVNIGMILLVLALVYVGFLFIVAQGKQEDLTKAKDALFWTVIGGLLLLGASALSLVVQEAIGVL